MGCEGSIVVEQHLPDQYAAHFGLGFQAAEVEQVPVALRAKEDAILRLSKGIVQEKGKGDAEESGLAHTLGSRRS